MGEEEFIPTLPLVKTVNLSFPVTGASSNCSLLSAPVVKDHVDVPTLTVLAHSAFHRDVDTPKLYVRLASGIISRSVDVPATTNIDDGVEELMPTLPFVKTVSIEAPVDETMENGFAVPSPCTNNLANGVDVPTPTLPFAKTLNIFAVCAESILNMEEVAPVEDANTDKEPWDIIPPFPTIKPMPAMILP